MSRTLRLVLTFACALGAWLWSGIAAAQSFEAPRCDVRGATTFAEPPVLQPLWRSLDVLGQSDDGCHPQADDDVLGPGHERAPAPDRVSADPITFTALELVIDEAVDSGSLSPTAHGLAAAVAHGTGLDRPPR